MKRLQSWLEDAGATSCLAIDYCYAACDIMGIQDENTRNGLILLSLIEASEQGVVGWDFYVSNPIALLRITFKIAGREPPKRMNIRKMDITSYNDLPMGYACVRHDYNGHSHFVLAKDGIRLFDSLEDSNCVKYGKPTTARIIEYAI